MLPPYLFLKSTKLYIFIHNIDGSEFDEEVDFGVVWCLLVIQRIKSVEMYVGTCFYSHLKLFDPLTYSFVRDHMFIVTKGKRFCRQARSILGTSRKQRLGHRKSCPTVRQPRIATKSYSHAFGWRSLLGNQHELKRRVIQYVSVG